MDTFSLVTIVLSVVGMAINFGLMFLNWRQYLRWERLNSVMGECALMAWRTRGSRELRSIYLENLEARGRLLGVIKD